MFALQMMTQKPAHQRVPANRHFQRKILFPRRFLLPRNKRIIIDLICVMIIVIGVLGFIQRNGPMQETQEAHVFAARVPIWMQEFQEGECCPAKDLAAALYPAKPESCRFMLPYTELIHQPRPPTRLPGTKPVCLLDDKWFTDKRKPVYSLLLPVFNAGYRLRVVLTQILKLTSGPWELLIHMDGSSDDSLDIVHDVLKEYESWSLCETPMEKLNQSQVWEDMHETFQRASLSSDAGVRHTQGELGHACRYFDDNALVHVSITVAEPPGILATAANNLGMRAALGEYVILLDDDQIMTTPTWNEKLAKPFTKWSDIFSLSMRCAHNYGSIGGHGLDLTGAKCENSLAVQSHDACSVFIRDSGNRGPLIIRRAYARELGFMDELHFMGFVTTNCDHDFNHRAFHERGWVSGYLPIHYTEERCCRSPTASAVDHLGAFKEWFWVRQKSSMSEPKSYDDDVRRFETRNLCA